MKHPLPLLFFLCFIPWSSASAQKVQNDGLALALGPGWTSMYEISRDARYNAIVFVPNGDTFKNWKKLITIRDFSEATNLSPEETLNKLEAKLEKECPGAMQWTVLGKDETSILYRWYSNVCGKYPEQDDIGRIIVGKYSWYSLDYTERVHELSPEARAQWIKTFSDATFDSVTLSLDSEWMSVDVDQVVAFSMDKVMAALHPAMESQDCKVSEATAERVECKRPRNNSNSQHEGFGGESVTVVLEAKGDQTHVIITTGKGFYGRLGKRNWSTPIYEALMKNLQNSQPSSAESVPPAAAPSETPPVVPQDNTPVNFANWGYHPTLGAQLTLKEDQEKNVKGQTHLTYHLESSGFPPGNTYALWMMHSGDHKISTVFSKYTGDATGKLVCLLQSRSDRGSSRCIPLEGVSIDVDSYHKGEPLDFAAVSGDGAVRVYARAYPFPIQAQDGKCTLNVEVENTKFTSFVIRGAGFEPGETVTTSSSFGADATPGTQQSSSLGEFAAEVQASAPGNNSGSATFAATAKSCHLTVAYEWGKAAKKVQ